MVGVVLVAALAVGFVKYRDHAHRQVAEHYVKQARPEHRRISGRMAGVYRSFSPQYLGGFDRTGLRRAKSAEQFTRRLRLATDEALDGLDYPRAQIKAMRDVLGTADSRALQDVDTPFLAGDSRQARDSRAIAQEERAYIKRIRAFLPRYALLVRYIDGVIRVSARYSITLIRGTAAVARSSSSPAAFSASVRRIVARLAPLSSKLRRLRPPPVLRRVHRANVAYAAGVVRDLKALTRAVTALDLPRIQAISKRLDRREQIVRRSTRLTFRRLATRSEFSRKARDLQRREERIDRRYRKLAGERPRPPKRPVKKTPA